jgi:Translation initiation factor IF-3, C-terminal domain
MVSRRFAGFPWPHILLNVPSGVPNLRSTNSTMLCQKCGLQKATVHLEFKVFRQKIQEHLCALCAGDRAPALSSPEAGPPKTTRSKIKEIEFSAGITLSEFVTRLRSAEELLGRGHKVKLRLKFRGRELAQTEIGFAVIKRAIAELSGMGQPDSAPKLLGRNIHAMLTPLPTNQRRPKFGPDAKADAA